MDGATHWPSTKSSLLWQIQQEGSQEAWKTFVDLYAPLIYRFCRRRGLQDADANDVTQSVFVQLNQILPAFEYDRERGRFRGWLGEVVRNTIRKFAESATRVKRGVGGPDGDEALQQVASAVEPEWIEEFNAHVYEQALARVRPEFNAELWRAFEAVWVQGRDPADVGRELQKTMNWVYLAKFRIIRRLKEEIEFIASDVAFIAR